ncbi:hypothetical protein LCGC14_1908920 [marine sediment metagenome]|uniref:LSM domain-containing protein n=1 Tax=marine sediment metagenome TaxID=412755 RepID=A0A0F9IS94_9ZZZZ
MKSHLKSAVISILILLATATLLLAATGVSKAEVVEVEGAKFNLKLSMEENLKSHVGRTVIVLMNSGKELTGKVKAVDRDYLHLESLSGREYFDALVRTDQIAAVIAKLRLFK